MADVVTSVATFEGVNQELILKPLYNDPMLLALGTKNIVSNDPGLFYFNTQLNKITVEKTTCGHTYGTGVTFIKKTTAPKVYEAAIEQCYDVFLNTFLGGSLPAGVRRAELSPEIQDILIGLLSDVFNRDMILKLFMSDTASAAGFYNDLDGVYKTLSADLGSTAQDIGALTLTDINQTNIKATMQEMYDAQNSMMKSQPNSAKKFWVTGNVFDAWVQWCQSNIASFNNDRVIYGIDEMNVTFNGIQLVPLRFVDRAIEADFQLSGASIDPVRIILTLPEQHIIQTDANTIDLVEPWYSKDLDVYRAAVSAKMAYLYGYAELSVIGGF
jgi:hypothetical protein